MISLLLRQADTQQKPLSVLLNTVVGEAKFKFDKSGVIVRVVDPAHVAMVNAEVPKEAFELEPSCIY